MPASADILLQKMRDNELVFQTLAARFNATYTEGEVEASISGTLRIRRDSIIWLSFSPAMGIEVMRAAFTRDSVKILDRIQKVAVLKDFRYLRRWVSRPLDLDMIQAMIIGNCLLYSDGDHSSVYIDRSLYRLDCAGADPVADSVSGQGPAEIIPPFQIWLDPENFKVVRTFIKETQGSTQTMDARYLDFKMTGEHMFPSEATFLVQDGRKRLELSLRYVRIRLNENLSFPFTIPEGYTKVTE
jgi:hypothetical protein